MTNFKIGDTVQLKSGGPVMTISVIIPNPADGRIVCTWFDKQGDFREERFIPDTLRLYHCS